MLMSDRQFNHAGCTLGILQWHTSHHAACEMNLSCVAKPKQAVRQMGHVEMVGAASASEQVGDLRQRGSFAIDFARAVRRQSTSPCAHTSPRHVPC